jgi:hypothetical protein
MPGIDRWRKWTPSDERFCTLVEPELTKPTEVSPQADEVSSVSFVSPDVEQMQNFSCGMATHDPACWETEFESWAPLACVFRDGCFGGIGCLHVDFAEWCTAHASVPCTRRIFELLLRSQGLAVRDGMVHGLVLKVDAEQ